MEEKEKLVGLDLDALHELVVSCGQPGYRAQQLAEWLYKRPVGSLEEMTNLPQVFRHELGERYEVGWREPAEVLEGGDGTRKYVFLNDDGLAYETAVIPDRERRTLCVSSQIGCKWGCAFCATGKRGFAADLDAWEMLNQYLSVPEREQITNIVFMGMGEPLDNYEPLKKVLRVLTDDYGFGLSPTRLTVSTIGIPEALEHYVRHFRSHLALSVHSPFPDQRAELMPVEKVFPLERVLGSCAVIFSKRV